MSEFTNTLGGGAGVSVALETPTGDVDGVNDEFTFTAVPIFIEKNGQILHLTEDYTLAGAVATLLVVPTAGAIIRGLV